MMHVMQCHNQFIVSGVDNAGQAVDKLREMQGIQTSNHVKEVRLHKLYVDRVNETHYYVTKLNSTDWTVSIVTPLNEGA